MDPAQTEFDQKKKRMMDEFTRTLLHAIQNNLVTREESRNIAGALLLGFKTATDSAALSKYMVEWSAKWKIFENIVKMETMTTTYTGQDQQKLEDIKKQLDQLSKFS